MNAVRAKGRAERFQPHGVVLRADGSQRRRVVVYLDLSVHDELTRVLDAEEVTLSSWVATMIRRELEGAQIPSLHNLTDKELDDVRWHALRLGVSEESWLCSLVRSACCARRTLSTAERASPTRPAIQDEFAAPLTSVVWALIGAKGPHVSLHGTARSSRFGMAPFDYLRRLG